MSAREIIEEFLSGSVGLSDQDAAKECGLLLDTLHQENFRLIHLDDLNKFIKALDEAGVQS